MVDVNNNRLDKAVDGDSKRARRASEESPAVPDPEVKASTGRRRFTSQYKLSILEQVDRCRHSGEIGALLRREGLYSSHLSTWRRLRREGVLQGLSPQQRGPKANIAATEQREIVRLQKQVSTLDRELDKAHTIIDVQKNCRRCCRRNPRTRFRHECGANIERARGGESGVCGVADESIPLLSGSTSTDSSTVFSTPIEVKSGRIPQGPCFATV